jgi:L-iditol 2-dehydrogenase
VRGNEHLCRNRQLFGMHRPGAFAEFVAVPEHCLFPIPAALAPEAACLTEPLANGVHMVRLTADLSPKRVLVIGAGPIGLLAQQAFRAMTGAQVLVSDPNPHRLAVASSLGAVRTIDPAKEDVIAVTRELAAGEGADVVIDAVGSEQTKRQSVQAVRAGGAVVWIGLAQDEVKLGSLGVTLAEIRIHGTYAARPSDMSKAIDLLARGAVSTAPWVTLAPLKEGADLFRRMLAARDGDIKGVIVP